MGAGRFFVRPASPWGGFGLAWPEARLPMTEPTLRLWHRRAAVCLAIFLLAQGASGLWISLGYAFGLSHAAVDALAYDVHLGGATWAAVYRAALALGECFMVVTGLLVFVQVRKHLKAQKARAAKAQGGPS